MHDDLNKAETRWRNRRLFRKERRRWGWVLLLVVLIAAVLALGVYQPGTIAPWVSQMMEVALN